MMETMEEEQSEMNLSPDNKRIERVPVDEEHLTTIWSEFSV
jgi:hypothetical protein